VIGPGGPGHALTRTRSAEAEDTLWKLTNEGKADCRHDRRFRALVLLAAFASLRCGEVIAQVPELSAGERVQRADLTYPAAGQQASWLNRECDQSDTAS